jgi:ribosomal protein L16 Arg81 hydroxylase
MWLPFVFVAVVGQVTAVPAAAPTNTLDAFELLIAPFSSETFFKSYFETRHVVFPRDDSMAKTRFLQQLAAIDELYGQFKSPTSYLDVQFKRLVEQRAVDLRNATGDLLKQDSRLDIEDFLSTGQSAVVKLEYMNETLPLSAALAKRFSTVMSTHPYISAPNAQALGAHTDPYDVFVVQTYGQKHWTICTPQPGEEGLRETLSQADLSEWYALKSDKAYGCHAGNLPISQMHCENVTLTAGDVLYLPKVGYGPCMRAAGYLQR